MKCPTVRGVNVFIGDQKQKKLFAVKRSPDDKYFAGMWALPGGAVEPGETDVETARREMTEETGSVLDTVTDDPLLHSIIPLSDIILDLWVYGGTLKVENQTPQDTDIVDVAWITPEAHLASLSQSEYAVDEIEKYRQFLIEQGFLKT